MTQADQPQGQGRKASRPVPLLPAGIMFRPAGNPSLPTFVSLMLIVTTFMIVLTSISLHHRDRMHDLLAGMRATFAGTEASGGRAVAETAGIRSVLEATSTGFRQAVPAILPSTKGGGNDLVLAVPLEAAIDPASGAVRRDFSRGLVAIATALAERPAELGYQIEMRLDETGAATRWAGPLAGAAQQAGIPAASLFIAGVPDLRDQLLLRIRLAVIEPGGGRP